MVVMSTPVVVSWQVASWCRRDFLAIDAYTEIFLLQAWCVLDVGSVGLTALWTRAMLPRGGGSVGSRNFHYLFFLIELGKIS